MTSFAGQRSATSCPIASDVGQGAILNGSTPEFKRPTIFRGEPPRSPEHGANVGPGLPAKIYAGNNVKNGAPKKSTRQTARFRHLEVKQPKYRTFDRVKEQTLIQRLKERDPAAQKWLYDRYSPLLFSVCRRYLRSREDAEEALVSGLFKVFSQIESYSGAGSFEGWMRRIVVNEALMMLRKAQNLVFPGDEMQIPDQADRFSVEADMSAREILELLDQLPNGYRTVFNLYVIEGFKHHEIADMLGISINTSKSQLILAKEKLRNLLKIKGY